MAELPISADPLDEACKVCGVPYGDHDVRAWLAHTREVPPHDVPFEAVELGTVEVPLLGTVTPSDHVDVRVMAGDTGIGRIGVVELHWQQGDPLGPPRSVARVHYFGHPSSLRAAAKLLNQSFHRAANVVEGVR